MQWPLPLVLQWDWKVSGVACAALLLAVAGSPRAQEADAPPQPVSLDKLLTVPGTVEVSAPTYGGATRSEWRARFDQARAERAKAEAALESARQELEQIASDTDQWQMQAPGLGGALSGGDTGPLSYRLRQEIRRQRDEIEHTERRLQELRVEARLAGVPEEWIEPEPEPQAPPQLQPESQLQAEE